MRILVVALVFVGMFVGTAASAMDVTLAWDPNTEPDLDGYTVYYSKDVKGPPYDYAGDLPLDQIPDPDNPRVTMTDLDQYTNYYFALTAYDINGNESSFSSSLCIYIDDTIQECAPASEISGAVGGDSGGGGSSGGGGCFIGSAGSAKAAAPRIFSIYAAALLLIFVAVRLVKTKSRCRVIISRFSDRLSIARPFKDG